MSIHFTLNGSPQSLDLPAGMRLMDVIRDVLGLTGTKKGCETGECGACSVLVDGRLRKSCLMLLGQVEGCAVTTIEGIHDPDGGPNDLQEQLLLHGATQCGYCMPGMVLAGEALLAESGAPTREEIRDGISGNLCRCTGYQQIVDAIEDTARGRNQEVRS